MYQAKGRRELGLHSIAAMLSYRLVPAARCAPSPPPNISGMPGIYATAAAFCGSINSNESWLDFCEFSSIPEIGADSRRDSHDKRSLPTNFGHVDPPHELRL